MKNVRTAFSSPIIVSIFFLAVLLLVPSPCPAGEIDVLTIGVGVDADTLNPHEQTTTLFMNISNLIHDTLFFQNPDASLEPRLATRYDVSEDGKVCTLQLRKGVKFTDGTEFNAEVMKQTFDRLLDPNVKVPQRKLVSMIEETKITGDYSLELHLKYPFAPLRFNLTTHIGSPISPKALEKYGEDIRQNPVGAGPFKLVEWAKGDRIVLERNDSYYGKKPTVKKIVFKVVPETSTREAMLRAGQIDVCYKPSPANIKALQADSNVTVAMPLSTRTIFMGLNCKKFVTKDKLVRQAFNYAVDKNAIAKKILFEMGQPLDGPCPPLLFGYYKMDKKFDYNPDKAKELLKEAGFDFSKTVHLRTPNGRYLFDKQIAEAVQAYLQAIGVKAELRTYDWPTYVAGLLKPIEDTELEVFLLGWGVTVLDADNQLYMQFHSTVSPPNGLGAAHYSNPEFDKVIEASRVETDPDKRLELLKKASEIVWDDCPWLWLHVEKFLLAHRSNIEGIMVKATEEFDPTYATKK